MSLAKSRARRVVVEKSQFIDDHCSLIVFEPMSDDDGMLLLFIWLDDHDALRGGFLANHRGQLAQKQRGRGDGLAQPQSDQLDRRFAAALLLRRCLIVLVERRLSAFQVESRTEFAKNIRRAREV